MKKNIIIKGVLLLIVLAVLTLGFGGCGALIIIPTTGTVYLVISGWWWYDLYMDYTQKYWGVTSGTYVLYNVPIGNHYFEAIDTAGWWFGSHGFTQYITAGVNYVYLNP